MVLLPMLEEFDRELDKISGLVQEMQDKSPTFCTHSIAFLLSLEQLSGRYSLPIGSALSVLRGELLAKSAAKKGDRKEQRRQSDERVMETLAGARRIVEDYFAPWRRTFEECAGLCRRMAAGAALKGLLKSAPNEPYAIDSAWAAMTVDGELAPLLAHVVGLAGIANARILLDQSLAHAGIFQTLG